MYKIAIFAAFNDEITVEVHPRNIQIRDDPTAPPHLTLPTIGCCNSFATVVERAAFSYFALKSPLRLSPHFLAAFQQQ